MIGAIDVVIPARDEEESLGACLEAVLASRRALMRLDPTPFVRCRVVVVLDACTDDSIGVAESFGGAVIALEAAAGNVGVARGIGARHVMASFDRPAEQWICSTDADTLVPESWLADHLAVAETGAYVGLGRVEPSGGALSPDALDAWQRAHADSSVRHVYGANLGVRADAYLRAGGFPAIRLGEDEELVRAVDALESHVDEPSGGRIAQVEGVAATSDRLDGRTAGGFAGFLRKLVD
ncbi:glycosyltransferase [Herbiconiux sp. P18]|uniref:glycosyltransferase n=1 Tax=Herbiconiux liangxiaofengii TaxID=3342795 RepID=UPI0035BA86C1